MKSFIKKNVQYPLTSKLTAGWGNGYVLIPIGHPLHGKDYSSINVDVHGGLTFSELVDEELADFWELSSEDIGSWCIGFDTHHYSDNLKKWPEGKVQEEADHLLAQIVNYKQ